MAKIDDLFKTMVEQQASDLHLTAGSAPYLRLHGEMQRMNMKPLSNEEIQGLVFEILNEKQKRNFIENWELDCSYTIEGFARFRCNVFMQRKGMGAVFRFIPDKIKTVDDLGLPKEMLDMIDVHRGLICVTGPTGSGKSTTLAALINHINERKQAHIITIEDPIEFVHNNNQSLINQREVTSHTKSFANALKATLREDPDIILVGEMRDIETISLALTAAETGHLVFGTLHTSSAPKTVDRIIDVFPENRQAQVRVQLAESLRGVIAQQLLTKADGKGRVPAFEIMFNNKAIGNLIREGKTFQIPSTMQITRGTGNITLEQSIEALIARGSITKEQGMEVLGRSLDDQNKADAAAQRRDSQRAENLAQQATTNPGTPGMPGMPQAPASATQQASSAFGNLANRFKKTS
jgi:twitching motility protein PilT